VDESDFILQGEKVCRFYAENLDETAAYVKDYYTKRPKLIKSQDMPFENSPHGILKHLVHEKMNTVENCVDIYMQFIPGGQASGKHRHLAEEVFFVVEGEGHDLHWDVSFAVDEKFTWSWAEEPRRFDWKRGDFVYIPPYVMHKHVNSDAKNPARIIVCHNRILKAMGAAWYEQVEPYEGFDPDEKPHDALRRHGILS
jgi:gentisate 1,2-dioxygenase